MGFIPIAGGELATAPVDELAAEMGRVLGVPAASHRAADYRGLIAALEQGTVHVAWVPPLIAARSVIERRVLPIALAVRDGSTSYWAALIAHRASAIRTPRDLKGAKAAWVDRESASGYTVIRMALRAAGVSLVDAFGEELFARSHGEVARLVMSRRVDVGATYVNYLPDRSVIVRGGWTRVDGVAPDDVRIVADAGPIPSDFIAVHKDVPRAQIDALTTALVDGRHGARLNACARLLLRADGFVRSTPDHVKMLEDSARALAPPVKDRGRVPA